MSARYIVACILVACGIAFFFLRPASKPNAQAPQVLIKTSKAQTLETNSFATTEKASIHAINGTNRPLETAYEMAAFIDQILDSVPHEFVATRDHLKGMQAVFFISDYVMAAKTNNSLVSSKSAIIAAFTNATTDTSFVTDRLQLWAIRPGTLTDHYRNVCEIPATRQNISAIKTTLTENGVTIDTESDLLMDCIRYAVHNTSIEEMYGANPRNINEATPFPTALNSLSVTGDAVFQHRFATKYGIDPRTVTNLMKRIKALRIYDLSPADVEIPVTQFQ